MRRLFKEFSLDFVRYGESATNEYGFKIHPEMSEFSAEGNLQPFRYGDTSKPLIEGTKTSDYRVFYTKEKLVNTDEDKNIVGDSTVIDGYRFEVWDDGDWTSNRSRLAHGKYILLRKEPADVQT